MKTIQIKTLFPLTTLFLLAILMVSCHNSPDYDRRHYLRVGFPEGGYDANSIDQLDSTSTSLNLYDTSSTEFPKVIFDYPKLEHLDLKFNKVKEIPTEIGQLKNLKYLELEFIEAEKIPDEITHLKKLEYLRIEDMELMEKIPEQIGDLQNLKYLIIAESGLKDVPESVGNLQNLEVLVLPNLVEKLPATVGKLKQLKQLNIFGTQKPTTEFDLPAEIGGLTELIELDFQNVILENVPPEIGQLKKLERLVLYSTQLQNLPAEIQQLKKLDMIVVDGYRSYSSVEIAEFLGSYFK